MHFRISIFFVLFLASCAKTRPTETLHDPDRENIQKSHFTGESGSPTQWLSKVTVIRTSQNGVVPLFVGYQSDIEAGRFELTQTKLQYRSILRGHEINSWNITHFDKKLIEEDGLVTNKEGEDLEIPWNQKRFFKIDFSKANISEANTFPELGGRNALECFQKRSSQLVPSTLDISSDYISFVVEATYELTPECRYQDLRRTMRGDGLFTAEFRYSFKKLEPSRYQPYVYQSVNGSLDPLSKTFGYFNTTVEKAHPTTGLPLALTLMNRWDPQKEHHFYFSKDFPAEHKWIFNHPDKGIFSLTNALLKRNGLPTRFWIHENTWGDGKIKELGDIRHSFIHIVEDFDPQAPLGFGPSDANPFTGEIVSANVFLWTGLLKSVLRDLEEMHARDELLAKKKQMTSVMSKMQTLFATVRDPLAQDRDPSQWASSFDGSPATLDLYLDTLPEVTFGYPGWARFSTSPPPPQHLPTQGFERLGRLLEHVQGGDSFVVDLKRLEKAAQDTLHAQTKLALSTRPHCLFDSDSVLSHLPDLVLKNAEKSESILNTILYRIAIHEFGHNLGLRHNFYGSVDQRNFRSTHSHTSSVMDYLNLSDEVGQDLNWEPYDEAALVFSLSGGSLRSDKRFLFCTDEHALLNALCKRWDKGVTPSQILMNSIADYDRKYFFRNLRHDRAYWDTSGYGGSIFQTMWDVKRLIPLAVTALNSQALSDTLQRSGALKGVDDPKAVLSDLVRPINDDLLNSFKLSIAFFSAVIQQRAVDRPWSNRYDPFSGELQRLGIFDDKVAAMIFLLGNEGFPYNPSNPMFEISYLPYLEIGELKTLGDVILENLLTERVDMRQGFIGLGRALFAMTSSDYQNRSNMPISDRIRVARYNPRDAREFFQITPETFQKVAIIDRRKDQRKIRDPYYPENDRVGIVEIRGDYYVASELRNPVAFKIIQRVENSFKSGSPLYEPMQDLFELHQLYQSSHEGH